MFEFYKFPIAAENVFFENANAIAFVNLKCYRPGHVLVASKRCVASVTELSPVEQEELAKAVHIVSTLIYEFYNADGGITVSLQDGKGAGQTVPHVHYHIMPKDPKSPAAHVKQYYDVPRSRKARTSEEQAEEVRQYKAFMATGSILPDAKPFLAPRA